MNPRTYRTYPTCCTSAFCGSGGEACQSCRHLQEKQAFEAWVNEHNAKPADRIWSPLLYVAQR